MILLSTASLNWYWLHRIFSFAKEAWFDGIDLSMSKLNYDMWDEDYLKELSESIWIPVLSITAPTWWMDEKKVDKIVRISKTLWSQLITFSPPHISDKSSTWFTKYLLRVKRDIHIWVSIKNVEPEFLLFVIPKYKNASLYDIKRVTGDTALDLSSIDSSSSNDILKAQKILWSSIRNIYLSDKKWPRSFLLPGNAWWWISYLPLESFLMKLRIAWYNGFISLKVRPSELKVGNKERVLQNLEYSINYYKKHFLDYK